MAYEKENALKETDRAGRRTDCHFYSKSGRRASCGALKRFYSEYESPLDQCAGCVFFKTDEEFEKGMRKGLFT